MQLSLDVLPEIPDDAYAYGERASGGTHGVVITKPHIVEFILNLSGYVPSAPLTNCRLLEPSCGTGAFVTAAARRLVHSARHAGTRLEELAPCLTALDVDSAHVTATRNAVVEELTSLDVPRPLANRLTKGWIKQADALLAPLPEFQFVVGNPPYIRIEQLAPRLQAEYRHRFHTLYDRADIYVAFIERGLSLLSPTGVLGFICADRWTLNKYGAPLRRFITTKYAVKAYIDLHTSSPFESDVTAYPSIFVIGQGNQESVPVARLADGSANECERVWTTLSTSDSDSAEGLIERHSNWFDDSSPWLLLPPQQRALLKHLENGFSPLEASATVGIGVATGCDSVYIVGPDADVEPSRLVPLVQRSDIKQGRINNASRYVINTFEAPGGLIELADYPRLANYFEEHRHLIGRRHVAKKNKVGWFRTIDRVYPELAERPKLLIPDIAGSMQVCLDPGAYHPHHNLYFVVSDTWDLEVLGGLLSSKVALFFVAAYGVRMRGGYLRFQAQYLRRIRLPAAHSLSPELCSQLRAAFRARDFATLDQLALAAYKLDAAPEFDFVDTRT